MNASGTQNTLVRRPVLLVFAVVLLLRLWVVSRYTGIPYSGLQMGDMKFYHDWAVRILHGQWTDGHAFYGLPGYAFLLAGFYRILGTNFAADWMVIGVIQSVVEATTAVLICKIATRVCEFENENRWPRHASLAGCAAGLAYAFFIPAQAFSIILMPTAWLVCAFWLCVWQAMQTRRGTLALWIGLGLLIGVMAMMIATILFAIPLLLLAIYLRQDPGISRLARLRGVLAGAALLLAGVGAGTSPAWLHNYFIAHDPVLLSAHGGLNFWMGNGPGATGYPKIPEGLRASQEGLLRDSIKTVESAAGHPLPRTEVSRYWSAKAKGYIHDHPFEWLRLMGVKVWNFWNAFQYDDISVITLFQERGVLLPGFSFGLLSALGLTGLAFGVRRNVPARWVAAAVLLHMAALLSVFVTERYRMAAAPGLLVLGVYVLWRLGCALGEWRWDTASRIALRGAAAAFFVSWPSRDPALWSVDPYNMGVKELEVAETLSGQGGNPEEKAANQRLAGQELAHAERHLQRAYDFLQGNAGILFALGNLQLDRGDREGARAWYGRTLDLESRYAPALKNLGYLAVEEKHWAEADRLLSAAAAAEADNASTWYLLAQAKIGLGDPAAARSVLEQALRMKPHQPEFLKLAATLPTPGPQP